MPATMCRRCGQRPRMTGAGSLCETCWRTAPLAEHATEYAGGSMLVWNESPCVTRIYPTAEKIQHELAIGAKVWRRQILVVEDWTEITLPASGAGTTGGGG